MKLIDDLKVAVPETLPEGKSRVTYTFLACLLGAYGVHNYWAGGEFAKKGKSQLVMGVLVNLCCCFLFIPGILSWISAIKDAATVK